MKMLEIERAKVNAKIAEIAAALTSKGDPISVFNGIYTNLANKVWEK